MKGLHFNPTDKRKGMDSSEEESINNNNKQPSKRSRLATFLTPSKPTTPQPQGPLLNEPSPKFLKPGPVGAPENNGKQKSSKRSHTKNNNNTLNNPPPSSNNNAESSQISQDSSRLPHGPTRPFEFSLQIYHPNSEANFYDSGRISSDYTCILSEFLNLHSHNFLEIVHSDSVHSSGVSGDVDTQKSVEDSNEILLSVPAAIKQKKLIAEQKEPDRLPSMGSIPREDRVIATTSATSRNESLPGPSKTHHPPPQSSKQRTSRGKNDSNPHSAKISKSSRSNSPHLKSELDAPCLSNGDGRRSSKDRGKIVKGRSSSGDFSKSKSESSSTLKDGSSSGISENGKGKGKGSGGSIQGPRGGKESKRSKNVKNSKKGSKKAAGAEKKSKKKIEKPSVEEEVQDFPEVQQPSLQSPETPGTFEESIQEASQKTEEVEGKEESKEESSLFRSEDEEVKVEELSKSATIWGTIDAGVSVFARWTDKIYYSGNIVEKSMNDTWKIAFDDNMDAVASESHILPMKVLGVGIQCVYCPDVIYQPSLCTIIGQKFLDDGTVKYAVQCIDKPTPLFCTRRHLCIKEVEAKKIRKEFNASHSKPTDLSILNIIESKIRPRTATGPDPPLTNSGKVDGRYRRRVLGGAFDESITDEKKLKSTPKAPETHNLVPKRLRISVDVDEGHGEVEKSLETRTNVSLVEEVDESKVEGSKTLATESVKRSKSKGLFDQMQFFLTATGGGDPSLIGASIGQKITSYDRDDFRGKLEANGGKVIDTVHVGKESKSKEKYGAGIFLISDSHARTVKYIYCLAAEIPIISFNWVTECLSQNKVADWKEYQINAGWSLEKQMVIPIHKEKPLRGLKIFMFSNTEDLFYYWKPVLAAAEADLLESQENNEIPPETEILVTDIVNVRAQPALNYARENNIPVVRPEWLVQTIICGERVEYDGHEKYLVQIQETEEIED